MEKRLKEIAARKVEIRKLLEADNSADLDALEKELRELDDEQKQLERRKAIAEGINAGTIEGTPVENPVVQRSDNTAAEAEKREREYRAAWLKSIRKMDLTDSEQRALTTGADSAGAVIPNVTQNRIIEKVHQYCPLLDKIDLLRVPGGVTIPAEGTTVDAQSHKEGATITADGDKLDKITLFGYEITKLVTISKSVEKMSIDAFENWLVDKIARKIAEKIGSLIYNGSGTNEATGIDKIKWDPKNSVDTAADAPTSAEVLKAVSLLNGGYDKGAEWLMSKTTFFTDYHPLMNKSKDNVVTCDNGVYRVMGYPVSMDDNVKEHEAFLGNFYLGYAGNMPEEVNITSSFVTRENAYDFLGSAMFDGKPKAAEAFVKVKKAAGD